MRVLDRFDQWVRTGPFTAEDLGIYRIIFAVSALVVAPDIAWLGNYPDFMFHAPPGPLRLLSGFPSPTILIVLEVARTASLVLVGLGLWTRYASIAAWLMLTVTYGLTYCLGKIDHTILLTIVPLILAFANWGDRFSVDAVRHAKDPSPQRQWPLRLLALVIGWAFFAAAVTKLATGWLSISSQSARGYFILGFFTEGRTHWLAQWVAQHDVLAAWEVSDWLTVVFEFSILLALPWWRTFRITLAVAALFHVGVLLVMNIDFSHAVVAYGAFVSWAAVAARVSRSEHFAPCRNLCRTLAGGAGGRILAGVGAVSVGAGAWVLMVSPTAKTFTGPIGGVLVTAIGAVVGSAYLARRLWLGVRVRSPRVTPH